MNKLDIDNKNTCCFSGHRIIRHIDRFILNNNLETVINSLYDRGIKNFITGGALGFDTLAAKKVLNFRKAHKDVVLILALPCRNQSDSWREEQKIQYEKIKKSADKVIYTSEEYNNSCMHKRNRFMVDNSSVLITYIYSMSSGTAYTTNYAIDSGLEITNILTL